MRRRRKVTVNCAIAKPQPRDNLGGWALNRLRQIRDNHLDLLKYVSALDTTNQLKKCFQCHVPCCQQVLL